MHPCEDDIVCKCTNENVPYFNAPVFLENKQQIGKVDEIFGPIRDFVSLFQWCNFFIIIFFLNHISLRLTISIHLLCVS